MLLLNLKIQFEVFGVTFDTSFSIYDHINVTCRSFYGNISEEFQRFVGILALILLCNSYMHSSRVDRTIANFYSEVSRKQKRTSYIESIECCSSYLDIHKTAWLIQPVLMPLHWLPFGARIEFKILLIVYKYLHGTAPYYLVERLENYRPTFFVSVYLISA